MALILHRDANGDDWQLEERLDADKKAIVNVVTKENIKTIDYVHRPDAAATEADGDKKDSALLQIYVQQGLTIKTGHLDTTARVDFTDISTGERYKIEIQAALRNGINLDIAPNVAAALVLLICVVVDDDLNRLSRSESDKGFYAS
ncbi:hypothetical protein Gpo141_00012830 [Globisporangium polare]